MPCVRVPMYTYTCNLNKPPTELTFYLPRNPLGIRFGVYSKLSLHIEQYDVWTHDIVSLYVFMIFTCDVECRINLTILWIDNTYIRMRRILIYTYIQCTSCIRHILYPAQSSWIQRVEQICRISYIRLRKTSLYDFRERDRCMHRILPFGQCDIIIITIIIIGRWRLFVPNFIEMFAFPWWQ